MLIGRSRTRPSEEVLQCPYYSSISYYSASDIITLIRPVPLFIRRVTILRLPVKDEDQEAKDEDQESKDVQGQVEDVDLEEMEEGKTGYSHKHCRQIAREDR